MKEMRCDCDKHPNIRAAHTENFNSLCPTSSKLLSVGKKATNNNQQPEVKINKNMEILLRLCL